jgi:hypothetical protein
MRAALTAEFLARRLISKAEPPIIWAAGLDDAGHAAGGIPGLCGCMPAGKAGLGRCGGRNMKNAV